MGKYEPLGTFLRSQRTQQVPMTFDEIERVTGVKLPPKAQHHRAWWSNNPSNNVMTKVWLDAGFQSAQVDMASRRLVFQRLSGKPAPESVANADRRHPLRGAMKGMIWIAPGTDLTQPAEPDWEKIWAEANGIAD